MGEDILKKVAYSLSFNKDGLITSYDYLMDFAPEYKKFSKIAAASKFSVYEDAVEKNSGSNRSWVGVGGVVGVVGVVGVGVLMVVLGLRSRMRPASTSPPASL